MDKKQAVVYIRVSTEDQKDGLSPDVQKSLCMKRAEEAGYEVIEVIDESGISGFKERDGIKRIQEYIKEKKISAIVALSSDRLFRNAPAHMEMMRLAIEREVKVLYVYGTSPDGSATSIMADSVGAVINQFYRDQVSEKVKATLYAKVEAGYFPSLPPVGYMNVDKPDAPDRFGKKVIEPHPIMAPLIKELFQLYSTGAYSVYDLTDLMNGRGLRSYKNLPLSPSRVFDLLKNRVYIGEVRWGKAYCKNGKHEPLVDEDIFNRVQAVMATNNHKATRRRKHKWLLAGFVICASHGRRYVGEWH
jgi:DNA invertase Pin-like site-specific DNA recombinase